MHFLVVRRRHLGVALDANELRKAQPVRGGIAVEEERVECLKRVSRVAKVRGPWPMEPPLLPLLLDVNLASMAPNGMILSGIEEVNGVMYAQSWWCRTE